MPRVIPIIVALLLSGDAAAQNTVSFPTDDRGVVYADAYGEGDRGIVLAHGGRFNKESWRRRLERLRRPDFECWRSTFVATVSREVQASPTQ